MGTIHNMEDYIKKNNFKCDYIKSKRIAKEDIKLLAMLDKIITNASEFNECWFNQLRHKHFTRSASRKAQIKIETFCPVIEHRRSSCSRDLSPSP